MDTNYNFPVALEPIYLGNNKQVPGKRAIVRTDTMDALGLASDKFAIIPHANVVDAFREAGKGYQVEEQLVLQNNGANLFYKMSFPNIQYEVKNGDFIKMMAIAKNSYSGNNTLQIMLGAFRLACSNGMIIGTRFMSFNIRHIGNRPEYLDIDNYTEAIKNNIALFEKRAPMLSGMTTSHITPVDNMDLFKPDYTKLPSYLNEEAKYKYTDEVDKSVWGYYNSLTYAITHKAKKESPARNIMYGMRAWDAASKLIN